MSLSCLLSIDLPELTHMNTHIPYTYKVRHTYGNMHTLKPQTMHTYVYNHILPTQNPHMYNHALSYVDVHSSTRIITDNPLTAYSVGYIHTPRSPRAGSHMHGEPGTHSKTPPTAGWLVGLGPHQQLLWFLSFPGTPAEHHKSSLLCILCLCFYCHVHSYQLGITQSTNIL
jgi:hypothetical protein